MNEPVTTPRKPTKPFEVIYRPAVLVLLAAILITQIVSFMNSGTTPECKAAIEAARSVVTSLPKDMTTDYQTSVYKKAENINQQIFMANEYNFLTLQQINAQQQVLLGITTACQR